MKIVKGVLSTGLAFGLLVNLGGCNAPSAQKFINDMNLSVKSNGNQSMISMVSIVDLGNVSLAELNIPVIDPKTNITEGNVNFSMLPDGKAQITLDVNAALIGHADSTLGQTLPNNNPVPLVLGATPGTLLAVPLLNSSRVYLGGDLNKAVYAGVALGIPGLDQVMNQLHVPANLFLMSNFGSNILAVGGIYGSNVPNQNGIAVFGKYTVNAKDLNANRVASDADFEIEKLNRNTKLKLKRFFFGKKRMIKPE